MNRRQFLQASAIVPVLAGLSQVPAAFEAPRGEAMKAVVAGNTAFAIDLYRKLGQGPGNQFFSPFSVSAALAMTSNGAANDTLSEMIKVLHLPADQAESNAGFTALTKKLHDEAAKGAFELRIANALWGQSGFPFKNEFLSQIKTDYGAGFQTVDFGNPERARAQINRWVEEQTKDKIKDLFPSGSINSDTRLVLANAIYFKGLWQHQFKKSMTSDAPFYSDGRSNKVPTMHQTARFGYAEGDDWQMLEMPYKNSTLVMNVVLPKSRDGLAAIEARVNSEWLGSALQALRPEEVIVSLPRFKTTISYDLTKTLAEMGMPRAFSRSQADFSRMTSADRLMIGVVVHKAFVDVTEEGTEAAAATGVGMRLAAAPVQQPPKVFNADHPFAFVIRDTATGALLFAGRVAQP